MTEFIRLQYHHIITKQPFSQAVRGGPSEYHSSSQILYVRPDFLVLTKNKKSVKA